MATISEVARRAGVTRATVSNVLRRPEIVKPTTVERVRAAIAEVGYRPNLMARALAEGRSSMVAVILPSITNPFYPQFIRVAERVARHRGYFLMVCNTDENVDTGRAYLDKIAGTLADGVLLLHSGLEGSEIEEMCAQRCPVVLAFEEIAHLSETLPHVLVDFDEAGRVATEHLISMGHTKIAAIAGMGCEGMQFQRLNGYKRTLEAHGLDFSEDRIRYVTDGVGGGYEAAMSLVDGGTDASAIFTTNDLLACGALNALADKGLSVPDDMSVIGLTDIQMASEVRPPLTTVSLRVEEIAHLAINLLLDRIEKRDAGAAVLRAPAPVLVSRASTAPPRTTTGEFPSQR
ncbi:LacI family DNA-binding transcriptional regulator [Niveibacterium sp. SC-1]|uniref:LacI family DNA-binding transcriptional regulator n=1 Tax=Niveibacterium sp. SC-1 TaxID=3135646 RepID=UPI0031202D9F